MPHVMCRRDWKGVFHRTINGVRTAFPPGETIEVSGPDLKFIADDLGKALIPMEPDGKGILRPVPKDDIPAIVAGILDDEEMEAATAPAVTPEPAPAVTAKQPKAAKPSLPLDEM